MTNRSTGPACGNNPNHQMSDGDRQAVADFRAYLAARAALARIRQMADAWEQQLPDVIRTPAVVSALRAALDDAAPAVVEPPADQTAPVCQDAQGCHRVVPCDPGCGTRDLLAEATRPMPAPADRAAVLTDVERAIRSATANCGYRADDGCDFCNGVDAALVQVRRVADETATTETHSCPNCDGIDPDTCFMNPDRPPEQCPRSEFEDYGQQCQKPAAGARQDGDPDRIVAYRSRGGRLLRCLAHHPGREAIDSGDFRPVTADELPDGGICTYPTPAGSLSLRCGVDVLIPQPAAGARQDEPDHVCNSIWARGEMDEVLGYLICGVCGKAKSGARQDGAES